MHNTKIPVFVFEFGQFHFHRSFKTPLGEGDSSFNKLGTFDSQKVDDVFVFSLNQRYSIIITLGKCFY